MTVPEYHLAFSIISLSLLISKSFGLRRLVMFPKSSSEPIKSYQKFIVIMLYTYYVDVDFIYIYGCGCMSSVVKIHNHLKVRFSAIFHRTGQDLLAVEVVLVVVEDALMFPA